LIGKLVLHSFTPQSPHMHGEANYNSLIFNQKNPFQSQIAPTFLLCLTNREAKTAQKARQAVHNPLYACRTVPYWSVLSKSNI
jgi:hypothetical protein